MFSIIRCPDDFHRRLLFRCESRMLTVQSAQVQEIWLSRSRRLPAARIAQHCGTRPVLLSRQIDGRQIQRLQRAGVRVQGAFSPNQLQRWKSQLLLNGAVELFELAKVPFAHRMLGIIDPQLRHRDLIECAVRRLAQVRVVTNRSEAAQRLGQELMNGYGAPVLFSDQMESLSEAGLVLSPEGMLPAATAAPVLTPEPPGQSHPGVRVLYSPQPQIPGDCAELLEEGEIDPMQLLGSLVLLERCQQLWELPCRQLCHGGEPLGMQQASGLVKK